LYLLVKYKRCPSNVVPWMGTEVDFMDEGANPPKFSGAFVVTSTMGGSSDARTPGLGLGARDAAHLSESSLLSIICVT
jgi:hypothetical protein